MRDALELILRFKDAMVSWLLPKRSTSTDQSLQDDLYAWSLAEATRLDRQRDASRGLYTPSTSSDDPSRSEEQLQSIRIRIRECSNSFQHRVVSIVHMAGVHADLDIRFLAIRIAFNGHYSLRKKDKGSSRSTRA